MGNARHIYRRAPCCPLGGTMAAWASTQDLMVLGCGLDSLGSAE
jgi:hypothetical protein